MNIVIPLGPDHRNDIELKFALRSLPPHDNLYIIGRNPNLPNIIHVPFDDKPGIENKQQNIYLKILKAFEFVDTMYFFNDDHFLIDFQFEYYYQGTLADKLVPATAEDYKISIKNTIRYLQQRDLPLKFFDVHAPIVYERNKFPVIDFPKYGFTIKSLYCNYNNIDGMSCEDCKIIDMLSEERIRKMIKGKKFFSCHDYAVNASLVAVLSSLYPLASRYELPSPVPV